MKKYYILKLDSYEGDGSCLSVSADGSDAMFVVLLVDGASADIVDLGYSSVEALVQAWSNVQFENLGEFS